MRSSSFPTARRLRAARSHNKPRPLSVPDFRLFWSGQMVSQLGNGIFTVALALEVLRISSSPLSLAEVLSARTWPAVIFSFGSGVVVDRYSRRTVILVSDAARMLAAGTLTLLVALGKVNIGQLVLLAIAFGIADAFFVPASNAVIPDLLPSDQLLAGNALTTASQQLSQSLFGPALGGAIVAAIGLPASFLVNTASFAVSCATLAFVRVPRRTREVATGAWHDLTAGLRFLRSRRWLWCTLAAAGVANMFGLAPFGVLTPLLVRNVLHQGPGALGLCLSFGGLGGLTGALVARSIRRPVRHVTVMWASWAAAGAGMALAGTAPNWWLVAVANMIAFGFTVYGDVLFTTLLQRNVPQEKLGRVFATGSVLTMSLAPLGLLAGGVLATYLGTRHAVLISGGLSILPACILFVPGIRDTEVKPTNLE